MVELMVAAVVAGEEPYQYQKIPGVVVEEEEVGEEVYQLQTLAVEEAAAAEEAVVVEEVVVVVVVLHYHHLLLLNHLHQHLESSTSYFAATYPELIAGNLPWDLKFSHWQ
jgi:hypothetical protein